MNYPKNINSSAENKLLLDQNQNSNNLSDEVNMAKLRLNAGNNTQSRPDSNVNRFEYIKRDISPNDNGMHRSATDGAMTETSSKQDKTSYTRSHCRNSSYEGLLMHTR